MHKIIKSEPNGLVVSQQIKDDINQVKQVIDRIIDEIEWKSCEFKTYSTNISLTLNTYTDTIDSKRSRLNEEINRDFNNNELDDNKPILSNYYGSFNATDVAALIDRHKNMTKTQALYNLLMKNHVFKNHIDRLNIELKLNHENRIFIENTIKTKLHDAINSIAKSSSKCIHVDEIDKHIKSEINLALNEANIVIIDDDVFEKLKSEFKSEIYKKRGQILESKSIDQFEFKNKTLIVKRNLKIYEYRGKLYKIHGRIDGYDINEEKIIEIKNRIFKSPQKQLQTASNHHHHYHPPVPTQDYIQCLIYMKMTKCYKCSLVECYSDYSKNEVNIEWNQNEFNLIDKSLNDLVFHIRSLTRSDLKELILKYNKDYGV